MATRNTTPKKITQTGPVGLRGIRNSDLYNNLSGLAESGDQDALNVLQGLSTPITRPYTRGDRYAASSFSPQAYEPGTPYADLGNSRYDADYIMGNNPEDVNEMRYENQPWWDTLGNGIGKMYGTAFTTFLSSLVGIPYGLIELGKSALEGDTRWSAIWDNAVTKGLQDANEWMDENMVNYRSKEQQESPWYDPSNLLSMNFIADDIIRNNGFMMGSVASMAVGTGEIGLMAKALGHVGNLGKHTKTIQNVLGSLFSATGEGMIEAKQGVDSRNKLELQRLDDALRPEYDALDMMQREADQEYSQNRGREYGYDPVTGRPVDAAYAKYMQQMQEIQNARQALDDKRAAGVAQIEDSGQDMGNAILLANQGILTLSNLGQFSKGMTKSFDISRHAAKTMSKVTKPALTTASRVSGKLADGYKVSSPWPGRIWAGTKGIIMEGSEEMNQEFASQAAGAAFNKEDANDYWKARLDPESFNDTTEGLYSFGKILDRGFQNSWGDLDQWQQFVVGGLTGGMGSYMPTKIFNQDKSKKWYDPRRYGEWQGGAIKEVGEFNDNYRKYRENIDDINKVLAQQDFPSRIQRLAAHTFHEKNKTQAAENDDMQWWQDEDDKQTIHDIQAFMRAGRLSDLRAIYDQIGSDWSDEDIDDLVNRTTHVITADDDRQQFQLQQDAEIAKHQERRDNLAEQLEAIRDNASNDDISHLSDLITKEDEKIAKLTAAKESYSGREYKVGAYVDEEGNRKSYDEIREELKHNSAELQRKIDSYIESINAVQAATGGTLTKDQEDNLAYLHNMGRESHVRMNKIMSNVRKQLPTKFLLKTDKTPEQLTQESASSDVVFSKNKNTKKGYVEVDTSTMTDDAFARFFQKEVLRGGNIRPEFAETADERAAREEEEKTLSEKERKQKARERASKVWQRAVEKQTEDAREQWRTNWNMLADAFIENYRRNNNASMGEALEALDALGRDLKDASDLYNQEGEYYRTLNEYMRNPGLIEKAKEKAEKKAEKEGKEQQQKNKFAGKSAREINQEVANGNISIGEVDDFSDADLNDVTDEDVKTAQQEAKKSKEIRQRANALKQHIQENLGDAPTQEEMDTAQTAMQMVDSAALNAEDPNDISIDVPELSGIPVDQIDPNASIEEVDAKNQQIQEMLADAFNAVQEDENAQDDIPEEIPDTVDDVETPAPETGHDPVVKTPVTVTSPQSAAPSQATSNNEVRIIPKNPLTEGAIDKIIEETKKVTNTNNNGTWRSTTTRHPYGSSSGTYHENIAKKQYGEDSAEYKRSKAIWEYLDAEGAFDRMDNASEDRITGTIHFMVKLIPEVVASDKDLNDLTGDERDKCLAIIMLNENGEVIGDLPLAQFEPSYRSGNPTQQVKDLMSLQTKLFDAFSNNYKKTGNNEAIVDNILHKEGKDNLGLTFDNARKSALVSRVKQTMRGVVPYSKTEKNTLNAVAGDTEMQLGVKVSDDRGAIIAVKRGDKIRHQEIVSPNVGTAGQPYLLLPTPSGEKIAVPFYTKPFNIQEHQNTELYKMLVNSFYCLLTSNDMPYSQKLAYFNKHMDVIEGLLQVERQGKTEARRKQQAGERVDFKHVVDITKDNVTVHLESLTDPDNKIDITVSNTGTMADIAKAIVAELDGTPINVSLQFINDKIEAGIQTKYTRSYNQVIGEIADVNLPKNTTHTVNGWFTIELAPSAGIKPSKPLAPKTTGTVTEVIGGRNIEINTDNYTAVDTTTGEVIVGDERVNLRLAQIKASKPLYKGKDFIQISIDGNVRTYDVKNNKFVDKALVEGGIVIPAENRGEREGYDEATTGIEDVVTNADNFEDLSREEKVQYMEMAFKAAGISKREYQPKLDDFDAALGEDELNKNKPGYVSKAKSQFKSFWDLAEAEFKKGKKVVTTSQQSEQNEDLSTDATPTIKGAAGLGLSAPTIKTVEEIDAEMKQNKTVTRQNKDAWAAIPDALKQALVNNGARLQLSYNGKTVVISLSNRNELIKELSNANMAAKSGSLQVSEAVKPMEKDGITLSREREREARRWLAKNLPSLSSEERTQFVDTIARAGKDGGKVWGSYRGGVIEIQRNAPMGTIYHEAFHYVMDVVLSPEERQAFIDVAKQEYGITDEWAAEERLANDFRRYALDENAEGIVGRIKRWLRKIKDRITRYNRIDDATVNQLFWKINNGELALRSSQAESFEERQQQVLREIRNVQKEKTAWRNLSASTRQSLKSSGLSEVVFNQMSLEEKEQYIRCKG